MQTISYAEYVTTNYT